MTKKNVYKSIYYLTDYLTGHASSVINEIYNAANKKIDSKNKYDITFAEFENICKEANPNACPTNSHLRIGNKIVNASYRERIYSLSFLTVNEQINKILVYIQYLDSDFIKLLNDIKGSTFFIVADVLNFPCQINSFENMAKDIFEYIQIIKKIEKYKTKQFGKYIK